MLAFGCRPWSVLAITIYLSVSAARAEMITPDSIPNPPSAVSAANGTPVYSNDLVTKQYAGLGLNFSDAAITRLNGISIWAPVVPIPGNSSANSASGILSYIGPGVVGKFVLPDSSTATTVSSLSVELVGALGVPLIAYGLNGQQLNLPSDLRSYAGPHGGTVYTFPGSGISSFSSSVPNSDGDPNPAWGIAEISFIPASSAPEPSSLVLTGLGALGLAVRWVWRRREFTSRRVSFHQP